MVSNVATAKRALVTLLKSLAAIYGVVVGITRESTDKELVAVPELQESLQGGCQQEGRGFAPVISEIHVCT